MQGYIYIILLNICNNCLKCKYTVAREKQGIIICDLLCEFTLLAFGGLGFHIERKAIALQTSDLH